MGDNQLAITAEPRTFHFDLPRDADINLTHEIYFIKHNGLLGEHTIKNSFFKRQLLYKCMETIFMNTENSKANEPHKFVLNLLQRLDLKA